MPQPFEEYTTRKPGKGAQGLGAFLSGLLFILTCLPVLTAGAGAAAAYQMDFNLLRARPVSIRRFFGAFRGSLRNGLVIELIEIACAVPAGAVAFLILRRVGENTLSYVFLIPLLVFVLFALAVFEYAYAYTGYFEQTVRRTLKNCALMATTYTRCTLEVVALTAMIPAAALLFPDFFRQSAALWILLGVPLLVFLKACALFRVFRLYDPALSARMRKLCEEREKELREYAGEKAGTEDSERSIE